MVTSEEVDEQLHEFMHTHRNVMRRFFQACGIFNGHPFMLFHIRRHPGLTQKQLADVMHISPASAAISLRRMEEAGLVARTPDERDGRVTHLTLTAEGQAMDDRCSRGKQFTADVLFRGFSDEERQQFSDMLNRMRDNLENADIQAWQASFDEKGTTSL
jgi:DNA-binding MarR family transcriptional regulator